MYDLISSEDLSAAPATWAVWQGKSGIAASATGATTLINIPGGGTPGVSSRWSKKPRREACNPTSLQAEHQ